MIRALKLAIFSALLFVAWFFLQANPGALFGFIIPAYSPWLNLGFLVAYFWFLAIAFEQSRESSFSDLMEMTLKLGGSSLIICTIVFIAQLFTGGSYVLPMFYIAAVVCSVISILVFCSDKGYKKPSDFFVYPGVFSLPILGMGIYTNVIPLMIVLWVPYLLVAGITLFFSQSEEIADWFAR
ncbi:hypothetical protein C4565_02495 [Candidatus Parcubacteria bacterium]|jgi:hypothetical protein|nr:MAG: hypothetical protein C4565_02495 [Candidatus Parcubacteria bacterium]